MHLTRKFRRGPGVWAIVAHPGSREHATRFIASRVDDDIWEVQSEHNGAYRPVVYRTLRDAEADIAHDPDLASYREQHEHGT